jgi:glycerol-3-phosphate acyltransferase PlsY
MPGPADLGEMLVPLSAAAACGYLLGSMPFGFLVARSRGVDIFSVGSRSPGATNVRRVLGRGPGNTVFVLDTLKGALAAGLPLLWAFCHYGVQTAPGFEGPVKFSMTRTGFMWVDIMGYVGLAFALIGHSFSCFTRFRGGKGVATAAGGLLVLMPLVALISAAIWVAVFYLTRYVSLASILAALTLPVLALGLHRGRIAIGVTVLVAAFVVIRHRANVRRLLAGTEKKFDRRKPDDPPPGTAP